jgi:hypothetical protein
VAGQRRLQRFSAPSPPLHLWEEVISILIVAEAAPLQNIPNKRVSRKIFFANDLAAI